MNGGGQERGLRSGTLAPALCVGIGEACRVAKEEIHNDHAWVSYLAKRLEDGIRSQCEAVGALSPWTPQFVCFFSHGFCNVKVTLNGDSAGRYPGNVNLSFAYVEGESLLMALKEISVSSGSACTSASLEPSYVLRALGLDDDIAHSSIR
jgi:cysteine desulfurase